MTKPGERSNVRPSSESRERLLDAAVALIAEVGRGRVTTRLVAERAGVNHGLVHYYFGSTGSLLDRAAERAVATVFEQMDVLLLGGKDLPDGIRQVFAWLGNTNRSNKAWAALPELLANCGRDPRLRRQYVAGTAELRSAVARRADGTPAAVAFGADNVAIIVVAALDGLLLHVLLGSDFGPDAAAEVLIGLLC